MCSIRPIIWGRYDEVRIHSTKEFRVQGLSPHDNIRPTMKWRSWTKTRSIDAKANEKKDSETNLRASVTHSNRKRNKVGSSTTSVAKEVGVTFLRSWEMWMLLSRIDRSQWAPQALSEMAMMTHWWHLLRLMLAGGFETPYQRMLIWSYTDQYVHIITRDTELVLGNEDDQWVAHECMRVIPCLGAWLF